MNSAGGVDVGLGFGARGVAAVYVVVVTASWGAAVGTARTAQGPRRVGGGAGGAAFATVVVIVGGVIVSGVAACVEKCAVGAASGLPGVERRAVGGVVVGARCVDVATAAFITATVGSVVADVAVVIVDLVVCAA